MPMNCFRTAFYCFLVSIFQTGFSQAASLEIQKADRTAKISQVQDTVIIIGAGIAGLTTAYRLKKSGISAKILEMSPHVGGRVRTANYPEGGSAEVGLEEFWEGNPALEIIRELKIPMETSATAFSSFDYAGKFYPFTQDTNHEFLKAVLSADEYEGLKKWDLKMAEYFERLTTGRNAGKIETSLMDMKAISFGDWIRQKSGLSEKTQALIRIESEPEYATSWDRISALDGIAEWHIFSGQGTPSYHAVGGNKNVVDTIAASLGKNRILLNRQVTNIRVKANGVEVTATDTSNFKQYIYHARYVVTTMPLFRLNEIQFNPPLSAERRQAIDSQGWGAYFTAHAILDARASRYWLTDGKPDSSVLPILSEGPLGVIYGSEKSEEELKLPAAQKNKTELLNFLVTGDHAERFNARTGSFDAIQKEMTETLEKRWPGVKKLIKRWTFYRYHPRAIASWPVGRSRFDELSDLMRRPEGNIYFAGDFTEGTHSDGAAWSAVRVVKDIAAREAARLSVHEHEGMTQSKK